LARPTSRRSRGIARFDPVRRLAAHYNSDAAATLRNFTMLLHKQISIAPFAVPEHRDLLSHARRELHEGVVTGAVKYDETVTDGLENAPTAYLDMLAGVGLGKRLLRISHQADASTYPMRPASQCNPGVC
jgi:NADPH-dependent curcumin reductase CurA